MSRAGALILAYLCVSGEKTASREKLAMLIWPEREKSVAFKNLRSTLWRMRHLAADLGPLITATEAEVTLGEIACDVDGFQALERSEEAFRTGLRLWRDGFLASADVPPGRYADWVGEQRRLFTQLLRAALIGGEERFADRALLRTACMHFLELDPTDTAVRPILERMTGGVWSSGAVSRTGPGCGRVPLPESPQGRRVLRRLRWHPVSRCFRRRPSAAIRCFTQSAWPWSRTSRSGYVRNDRCP